MVGVGMQGELLGAAWARPSSWVNTIPAAEAWGLWMVTANTPARRNVVTDCKTNWNVLRAGWDSSTSYRRKDARTWRGIMQNVDDAGQHDWLVWMPAHTSASSARTRRKSDDTAVSATDRLANAAADALAKHAAHSHRAPARIRQEYERARDVAVYGRALLGTVTYASQRHQYVMTRPDGAIATCFARDSTVKPAGNAPTRRLAMPAEPTLTPARPALPLPAEQPRDGDCE